MNPGLAKAHYNAGLVYRMQANYIKAKHHYEMSVNLSKEQDIPDVLALSYCELANMSQSDNEYSSVVSYSTQAIDAYPKNADAYALRASAYRHLGNYPESIADAKQAIQLEPNEADHYASLAKTYMMMSNYAQAKLYLEKALQLNSEHGNAHHMFGWIYANKEQGPKRFDLVLWHYFMADECSRGKHQSISKEFNDFLNSHTKTELINYIKQLSDRQAYRLISSALKENTPLSKEFNSNIFTSGSALEQLQQLYAPLKAKANRDKDKVANAAIILSSGRQHAFFGAQKELSMKIAADVAEVVTEEESAAIVKKIYNPR
jgi:tetratricopeptide (TPR) repeat protein